MSRRRTGPSANAASERDEEVRILHAILCFVGSSFFYKNGAQSTRPRFDGILHGIEAYMLDAVLPSGMDDEYSGSESEELFSAQGMTGTPENEENNTSSSSEVEREDAEADEPAAPRAAAEDVPAQMPQASGAATAARGPPTSDAFKDGNRLLLCSVDTELVGPNRYTDGIASIGMRIVVVTVAGGWPVPEHPGLPSSVGDFYTLVRPPKHCIPNKFCSSIHKIPEAALLAAPTYEVVIADFRERLAQAVRHCGALRRKVDYIVLVGHNGGCLYASWWAGSYPRGSLCV